MTGPAFRERGPAGATRRRSQGAHPERANKRDSPDIEKQGSLVGLRDPGTVTKNSPSRQYRTRPAFAFDPGQSIYRGVR